MVKTLKALILSLALINPVFAADFQDYYSSDINADAADTSAIAPQQVTLNADRVSFNDETGHALAEGNAVLKYNDTTIMAERIEYDADSQKVKAMPIPGEKVVLTNGSRAIKGDQIDYDLNSGEGILTGPASQLAVGENGEILYVYGGEINVLPWELAQERGMLLLPQTTDRPKPWNRKDKFSATDIIGKLHIVLGNGIYIDTLNLMPRIQNQIRSLAAFDNPVFYKNKRLGYSNYYNFSAVYLGQDENGYIHIPRGLRERVIEECKAAGIEYDIEDMRSKGRPLRISFNGELKSEQQLAADGLLEYDNGILSAATAFGKTVVCSYLIARKRVSTLILVQNKELLNQWVDELCRFLVIDEEPPTYTTPKGRIKKRDSVIGVLHGNKNTLMGIIDVAMTQSLANRDEYDDILKSYGMVIMDECHHGVNAKYVYGVSATPKRGDDLEKIVYMLIGPVRHRFTAKERALQQGIGHYIYPRYTRVVDTMESRNDINGAYSLISNSKIRDEMLVSDVTECISRKRTPVILTKQKDHAKRLYEYLQGCADKVYLLYGDNTDKENALIIENMRNLDPDQSMILVATGQKVGEGFNYPRLDTLMLAAPLSDSSRVEQYVGRLNRDYPGKQDVIVYDYIDSHIRLFSNMYKNRLKTYKRIGYEIVNDLVIDKQFMTLVIILKYLNRIL